MANASPARRSSKTAVSLRDRRSVPVLSRLLRHATALRSMRLFLLRNVRTVENAVSIANQKMKIRVDLKELFYSEHIYEPTHVSQFDRDFVKENKNVLKNN